MISVIVPVYNAARYLPALMDSIQTQSYQDLEIIFVNDGSTDDSRTILDRFAAEDYRVKVIHKENGGVSSARNAGLDVACGEYIAFADSDDTMEPDLYEILLRLIDQYQVKIAHCSYNRIREGTIIPVGNTGGVYIQHRIEALRELTCGTLIVGSCWGKLYARELFDGVRFDTSLKLSEDEVVNFKVFSRAGSIAYQDVCKYNYLDSDTSVCRNTNFLHKAQNHVAAADMIWDLNTYPELRDPLRKKRLNAYLELYKALVCESVLDQEALQNTANQIRCILKMGGVFSRKQKLMYAMMRICPTAFCMLYRVYDRIRVID